jgi:hypothetical protein
MCLVIDPFSQIIETRGQRLTKDRSMEEHCWCLGDYGSLDFHRCSEDIFWKTERIWLDPQK